MKIICFEGVNGVGKSVICDYVQEQLTRDNYKVVRLREPGGTVIGEKILRPLLKNEQMLSAGLTPDSRLYLFLASRALNANLIKSITSTDYIILDRYTPSTLVYNGLEDGRNLEDVYELERHARKNIIPNITFYINAKDSEIVSRIWERDYTSQDFPELDIKYDLIEKTRRLQKYYHQANAYLRVNHYWNIKEIDNHDGQLDKAQYEIMRSINGVR